MSMVIAKRAGRTVKVSRQAYEAFYKKAGYKVVQDEETKKAKKQQQDKEENVDVVEEEYETTPISDMSKEQLMEYARHNNIDTSGAKNVSEARRIIKDEVKRRRM